MASIKKWHLLIYSDKSFCFKCGWWANLRGWRLFVYMDFRFSRVHCIVRKKHEISAQIYFRFYFKNLIHKLVYTWSDLCAWLWLYLINFSSNIRLKKWYLNSHFYYEYWERKMIVWGFERSCGGVWRTTLRSRYWLNAIPVIIILTNIWNHMA